MAHQNPFRLNVGFVVNETVGYTRDFDVDLESFQLDQDVEVHDLTALLHLSKTQRGIVAEVTVSGIIAGECARCLDEIDQKLATHFTEMYAFDERGSTEAQLYVPESGIIDFLPVVREYLLLDMPMNALCRPDCKGLCPICGTNWNEANCDCEQVPIDPRLAKLKDLLEASGEDPEEDAS
jgi:uncharacterized protein